MRFKFEQIASYFSHYRAVYAFIGFANLSLVCFDALYLTEFPYAGATLRDLLHNNVPSLVRLYDPVKGIEPHRFTEDYIADYRSFTSAFRKQEFLEMERLSGALIVNAKWMIDEPASVGPFASAGKTGAFERIKNRMRGFSNEDSAKDAFESFFQWKNVSDEEMERRFSFFESSILPYFLENYYRSLGEDGQLQDYFYKIDIWFVLFFAADFFVRWIITAFYRKRDRWYLFFIHRWFEIFLLFPPEHAAWFRLLRIFPFYIRLKESGLFKDGGTLVPDIIHDNASFIAREISGMVLSNLLARAGSSLHGLESSDLSGILNGEGGERLKKVFRKISEIATEEVLPGMSPDLSALVRYSLRKSLDPWLVTPAGPLVRFLILNLEITADDILKESLESPQGKKMIREMMYRFMEILAEEIAKSGNFSEIRDELSRFLAESGEHIAESSGND